MPSGWILDPSKALDLEEAQRILRAARNMADAGRTGDRIRDARNGHLICFLFGTGCRVSEALQATLGDVTSHKEAVYVRLRNLKRRDTTATPVPILGREADHLRAWVTWLRDHRGSDACPLFPRARPSLTDPTPKPLTRQAVWIVVKRVLRDAGVERRGVCIHAIRHGVAVATLKATGNMRVVQGRLRHASILTTEVYARLLPGDFRDGVEAAQALLERDADPPRDG